MKVNTSMTILQGKLVIACMALRNDFDRNFSNNTQAMVHAAQTCNIDNLSRQDAQDASEFLLM